MRIDLVTDTFAPDVNGVAMTLGKLCEGLRERGHRVHIIHTAGANGPGESEAAAVPLPGYPEVRVGLPGPIRLRRRWLKKRPDVIYVATESPLGRSALKAANKLGIPALSGFHTNFHHYMEKYHLRGLQSTAMAYLRRFHLRADRTLAPSPELVGELRQAGLPDVRLMGRGVDTALFSPHRRCTSLRASWGASHATPVILVCGRVAPEKNLDLAVRCFERIRLAIPDSRFVVVGDGPLRERLAQSLPWVHFSGTRLGTDLAAHYASADVLLFPSETETFGNVVLESMASGLVTVCYDYAAAARHMDHRGHGLKAPPGEEEHFISLAHEAATLPKDHPIRHAARERAESLQWGQVVDCFEENLRDLANARPAPNPSAKTQPGAARPSFHCRTLFLSDLHLGTPDSKAREVVDFLKHIRCDKLVLNGDIIDGWALRRGSRWRSRHTRVIRKILKMMEQDHTEVIYLRGNHDDILERFLPLAFGRVRVAKEHIHTAADGKRYLVIHGDGFDSVSTHHRWLAGLGAIGYDFLLKINRLYNRWRAWNGREYYSISKNIKARVKSAVSFVDRYEDLLQELARHRRCEGILCGHIHTPADKWVGSIRYLNSGDWVESLTAILEHHDGRMELVEYKSFLASLQNNTPSPATSDSLRKNPAAAPWNQARENAGFPSLA